MEWVSSVVLSQAHLELTSTFESTTFDLARCVGSNNNSVIPKPEFTRMENQLTGTH